METQTAFIGDRQALVRELAAELSKALQAQPIEPAMNVKEAADFLKISPDQVRELAERGLIPAFKTSLPGKPNHWRFWKHQLAAVGMI